VTAVLLIRFIAWLFLLLQASLLEPLEQLRGNLQQQQHAKPGADSAGKWQMLVSTCLP
jgi:hypothetical protein